MLQSGSGEVMGFLTLGKVGVFTLLLENQPPSLGRGVAGQRTGMTGQPYTGTHTLRNGPSQVVSNHNLLLG